MKSNWRKLEIVKKEPNNTPRTLSYIVKGGSLDKCDAFLIPVWHGIRWETLDKHHIEWWGQRLCGWLCARRSLIPFPLPFPFPKNESHLRPNSRDLGFGCLIFLAVAFGFTWGSTWPSTLSIFGQRPNWLYNNWTVHTTYVCARGGGKKDHLENLQS